MMRGVCAALILLAASQSPCAEDAAGVDKRTLEFAELTRSYYVFDRSPSSPAPVLIALHGSYGKAETAVATWIETASANAFVVVGPQARELEAWQIRDDSPAFLRAVVDDLAARRAVDRRRVYLFGHSGGAVYALTLAMIESEFYAAAAVHAGAWRTKKELGIVEHARRTIPVAIFIGDRDGFFPVAAAEKTRDVLAGAGHPVELVVMPRHGHRYEQAALEVNQAAWRFLSKAALAP